MALLNSSLDLSQPEKGGRLSAQWLRNVASWGLQNRIRSVVGGTIKRNPDGVDLLIPHSTSPVRCYVAYGADSISVTAGGVCSLTALTRDHHETEQLSQELGTLAANAFTFTKVGQYLITYHASFELDIGGATTHVPAITDVTSYLRADANTLAGSTHYASAAQVLNLSVFMKADGEDQPQVQVELGGATGKTESLTPVDNIPYTFTSNEDYGLMSVATTTAAIGTAEFDVNSKIDITLDTQTLDATDNFGSLANYTPSHSVRVTTSGTALIKVALNSSGALKIIVPGPTEYAPVLDIYATGADSRVVTNVSSSLSITRLT